MTSSFPTGDYGQELQPQPSSLDRRASIGVIQDMEEEIRADPWPVALFWRGNLDLRNREAKTQFELIRHEGCRERGSEWDQKLSLQEAARQRP